MYDSTSLRSNSCFLLLLHFCVGFIYLYHYDQASIFKNLLCHLKFTHAISWHEPLTLSRVSFRETGKSTTDKLGSILSSFHHRRLIPERPHLLLFLVIVSILRYPLNEVSPYQLLLCCMRQYLTQIIGVTFETSSGQ